jgi:uncharacterized membrane protein
MFETLLLLIGPTAGFRLLGALRINRFATWRASVTHGLAAMLVITGITHFAPPDVTVMPNHDDLVAMIPPFVPFPRAMVYVTGVLELLGAAGLVRAATRSTAGIGLAVLFVLMLPANIYAAVEDIPFNGDPATPLWFRVPEQLLYVAIALWAAAAVHNAPRRRLPARLRPGTDDTAAAER